MSKRSSKTLLIIVAVVILIVAAGGVWLITGGFARLFPQQASLEVNLNEKALEDAIKNAVLAQQKGYGEGETATEGHVILGAETRNNQIMVYTIASFGAFGFENGIFTKVSGSGAIPTVMTFVEGNQENYSLHTYKEPQDGSGYSESLKKMFPTDYHDYIVNIDEEIVKDLTRQQEEQAAQYLESIGRKAEVSINYVDRILPEIDTGASNKLFSEYTKNDRELNNFPYWIGTRELIEGGARCIYETLLGKTEDNHDLIVLSKWDDKGTLISERRYKIVGSEPQLDDRKTDRIKASKGLELYIWQNPDITGDEAVRYTLLPGTNRNKDDKEIYQVAISYKQFSRVSYQLDLYAKDETLIVVTDQNIDKEKLLELNAYLAKTQLNVVNSQSNP